eukprot:gnl/TRDRNA2_/TRDRNA2_170923_c3_seq3.p1 gnl/TRDRNA2_/TRDRNA2_170923_c3~~gnl/TRDRNA2_/TRDRNA2_170923_c3_seq3.p1  ORF type:complete len:110 (-),score=3.60 gnl/TRDRNA2_/TRDRNA2_170923_c3_seq3:236-565(-)
MLPGVRKNTQIANTDLFACKSSMLLNYEPRAARDCYAESAMSTPLCYELRVNEASDHRKFKMDDNELRLGQSSSFNILPLRLQSEAPKCPHTLYSRHIMHFWRSRSGRN